MNRGDIWLAEVGNKTRPVLIVTRQQVIDVRRPVTVAEIRASPASSGLNSVTNAVLSSPASTSRC